MTSSAQNAITSMLQPVHSNHHHEDENKVTLRCRENTHIAICQNVNNVISEIIYQIEGLCCNFDLETKTFHIISPKTINRLEDDEIHEFAFYLFQSLSRTQLKAVHKKMIQIDPRFIEPFQIFFDHLRNHQRR